MATPAAPLIINIHAGVYAAGFSSTRFRYSANFLWINGQAAARLEEDATMHCQCVLLKHEAEALAKFLRTVRRTTQIEIMYCFVQLWRHLANLTTELDRIASL
jgi:hypothetical protein